MSDLISRQAVLDKLKDFSDMYTLNEEAKVVLETIVRIVTEQPTTYDISKVVAELEEMIKPKQFYFCKYEKGGCKYIDDDKKDCMECVVEHAIDIVRKGGVE